MIWPRSIFGHQLAPASDCWGPGEEIAGEEDARAQTVRFVAKTQLPSHLPRAAETYIDAIKVVDDIKQKEKRQQPPCQLGEDLGANVNSGWRVQGILHWEHSGSRAKTLVIWIANSQAQPI